MTVFDAATAAQAVGVSVSGLRRLAPIYEEVYGELPRGGSLPVLRWVFPVRLGAPNRRRTAGGVQRPESPVRPQLSRTGTDDLGHDAYRLRRDRIFVAPTSSF